MESMNFKYKSKKIKCGRNIIRLCKRQDNNKEKSYRPKLKPLLLNIKSKANLLIKIQLKRLLLKIKYMKVKLENKLNKNSLMQKKDMIIN